MKLKRLPQDFEVEEQISLPIAGGAFAVYRLTKQSLGTLEAVDAIRKKWDLPIGLLEFAGLKDKHALTVQYVTIRNGSRKNLAQTNLRLEYVGQAPRPIHASDITSNQFSIVLRELTASDVESANRAMGSIAKDGLPNYFDNQRFGSLGESGEFIAKPWCLGDYERALWLALADPNTRDRSEERLAKQALREHWGDWRRCRAALPDSRHRRVLEHLTPNPTDFRRAIAFIPQELRSLWLAAYQSHLWNQILAALIETTCGPTQCTTHPIGNRALPFFQDVDAKQRAILQAAMLPLPSARLHLSDEALKSLYDRVLAAEGIELRQVRVKYPRDSFFSKGDRQAVFLPANFQHEFADDDVYPGRQKLLLRFALARGSYATILVKKIAGVAVDEIEPDAG